MIAWIANMNFSAFTSQGSNKLCTCLLTITGITATVSKWTLSEFSEVKASIPITHTDTPFSTPNKQLEGEWGKPLVIRLSFPLIGCYPEILCEGAKWSSNRQIVCSSRISEAVSPAGREMLPAGQEGENKHGAESKEPQQIPANEYM